MTEQTNGSGVGEREEVREAVLHAMSLLRTTNLSDAALAEVERIESEWAATPDADHFGGVMDANDDATDGAATRVQSTTPDADDASEGLTEAERRSLGVAWFGAGSPEEMHPAVERIVAARVSVAATRARAEEIAAIQASLINFHGSELVKGNRNRADALRSVINWMRGNHYAIPDEETRA